MDNTKTEISDLGSCNLSSFLRGSIVLYSTSNTHRVLVDAGGLWMRNFITFLLSSGGNPEFRP